MRIHLAIALITLGLLAPPEGHAGEAEVVAVRLHEIGGGRWRVDATVRHDDEGWEHYADAFQVSTPAGEALGRRVLLHPHVDEQPFTRSLEVVIPTGIEAIVVRAHDKIHGPGPKALIVPLPTRQSR